MIEQLDTYDWAEAFQYAGEKGEYQNGWPGDFRPAFPGSNVDLSPFARADVAEIFWMQEGENDGPSWIIAGRLNDGRFFFLEACCDYTGWDCQAGGTAVIASTKDELIRCGMTDEARGRFGISLEVA